MATGIPQRPGFHSPGTQRPLMRVTIAATTGIANER